MEIEKNVNYKVKSPVSFFFFFLLKIFFLKRERKKKIKLMGTKKLSCLMWEILLLKYA